VYFTGGANSELTQLYPLVIITAGIIGTPKQTTEITVLAIVTYVLMATLLSNRWLIAYMPAHAPEQAPTSGITIFLTLVSFALFGVASVYISKRCQYMDMHHRDLTETAETLLLHIPTPAVLLDHEGYVLYANQPAFELLATNAEAFCSSRFSDWIAENEQPLPEKFKQAIFLKRTGSAPVPVLKTPRSFQLQEYALLGSNGRKDENMNVSLVGLTDISDALAAEENLHKMEQIAAATRIAGDMAHEVRTPLTAISASIQLLRHYESRTTAADWLPNSPRRIDRKELFDHIDDASRQLDDVINRFIDFAEFSPADLLSIIKLDSNTENTGYIGHLNTVGRGFKNGQNSDCG
jgi:signal transduction histidine kinase